MWQTKEQHVSDIEKKQSAVNTYQGGSDQNLHKCICSFNFGKSFGTVVGAIRAFRYAIEKHRATRFA